MVAVLEMSAVTAKPRIDTFRVSDPLSVERQRLGLRANPAGWIDRGCPMARSGCWLLWGIWAAIPMVRTDFPGDRSALKCQLQEWRRRRAAIDAVNGWGWWRRFKAGPTC